MKFLITIIEIKIKGIDTCANLKAIKSKIEEHIIFGIQKNIPKNFIKMEEYKSRTNSRNIFI